MTGVQTCALPISMTISLNNNDILNLITVGRLENQKGYDRIIKVLAKLKREDYKFHLKILGEGSERDRLEDLITQNELKEYVELTGFTDNPYPYVKNADLFVCSSRSEGYSTVITESLILGTPVITTDCSGMRELLKDGEIGLIVENESEKLYSGLKELFKNPDKIRKYKSLLEKDFKRFDTNTLMSPIEELLKSD